MEKDEYSALWERECYKKERNVFCECGHGIQDHGCNTMSCYGEDAGTVGMYGRKTSTDYGKRHCEKMCDKFEEEGLVEIVMRVRKSEV